MKVLLWLIRETPKARLYSKTPQYREMDLIWIPRSVVEHTTNNQDGTHIVTVPDWWSERNFSAKDSYRNKTQ